MAAAVDVTKASLEVNTTGTSTGPATVDVVKAEVLVTSTGDPTTAAWVSVLESQVVVATGTVITPNPAWVSVLATFMLVQQGSPNRRSGLWTYRGGVLAAVWETTYDQDGVLG